MGLHVTAEVELRIKLSRTAWTIVALDTHVDFRMLEQVGFLSETVRASLILALVGLLIRMNSQMIEEIMPLHEDSIAAF